MPMSPRLLRPRASRSVAGFDPAAAAYITAVETADGQALETAVKNAINSFVLGCKADGIWSSIKASCILMGARTLAGALTPLVGSAPTNNGPFVSGDYNRKTGLAGNGTSKYLDTTRNANADPQDNFHMALFLGEAIVTSSISMGAGAASTGSTMIQGANWRNRSGTGDPLASTGTQSGFFGMSRASSSEFIGRNNGTSTTFSRASQTPHNGNILTHARNSGTNVAGLFSAMRLSYYSIGESLNVAALDSRVSALSTAIAAAIP